MVPSWNRVPTMLLTRVFCKMFVGACGEKNPFEDDNCVGITNYINFGVEVKQRVSVHLPGR